MKHSLIVTTLVLAGLLLISCNPLSKMQKDAANINYVVTPNVLEAKGDVVDVKIDVTIPPKYFNKGVTLAVSPVISYEGGEIELEPKILQGENVQGNDTKVPYESGATITYNSRVPYEDFMRISDLVVKIQASVGTMTVSADGGKKVQTTPGKKTVDFAPIKVASGVITTSSLIWNVPAAILAEDKFTKTLAEQTEAAIYYQINSSQLGNKSLTTQEIKDLEKYLKASKADEKLRLNNVEIHSFASPDGAYSLNERLANSREKTSDGYLKNTLKKTKIDEYKNADFFKKYVVAEDWDGFKKAMESSDIRDKELILRVLEKQTDPEIREKEIKNIASVYTTIANQILPKLRRSKLVVKSERVAKSNDEVKSLAKSNPSALNVEELLYAATLFDNNADKLAIYEAGKNQFPDDWRVFNDAGLVKFETGKLAEASADFEKANSLSANNPIVKNNLGAIALKNGKTAEAEVLFGAATGGGDAVNYNKGIIAIIKGDYKNAVTYFGNHNDVNAALANVLAGNNSVALKKLNDSKDQTSLGFYLKALIGARTDDASLVLDNLRNACIKDSSMKKLAATDIEFAKFFADKEFQSIVKE
ncbi:hypothetical protein FACS1894121_0250 [Bacteroidia bacterium]|nr:hypothetical protein FACS1894121_0250 [Bacteroidia bacterium]